MLPSIRQRIIFIIALIPAIGTWLTVAGVLRSIDQTSGFSLFSSGSGTLQALICLILASVVVLLVASVPTITGTLLSGALAFSCSLCVLAGVGGTIDGWMRRSQLPADYGYLMIELIMWLGIEILCLAGIQAAASKVKKQYPKIATKPLFEPFYFSKPRSQTFMMTLLMALVSGLLSAIFIQSTDVGQIIGAVTLSFMIGGAISQSVFTKNQNLLPAVGAPCLVGLVTYTYVLIQFSAKHQVLAAWYNLDGQVGSIAHLAGPALVLPIYYASAGLAGGVIGLAVGQTLTAHPKS